MALEQTERGFRYSGRVNGREVDRAYRQFAGLTRQRHAKPVWAKRGVGVIIRGNADARC